MLALRQDGDGTLLRALGQAARETEPERYLEAARAVLRDLVRMPALLDGMPLARVPGGYARTQLYGDGRITVLALTWAPGAVTPIHDHHCSCCFGVVSGAIRETWFRALDDRRAIMTGSRLRGPADVACMLPTGPNLHRMTNEGDAEAVTIHLYGFDHRTHTSSIHREYEAVNAEALAASGTAS